MLSKWPSEIKVPREEFEVTDSMLSHPSDLHGRGHIHRVMHHSLLLCRVMGYSDLMPECLCAAHLHDLARQHDGPCADHGGWAIDDKLPQFRKFYERAGVKNFDAVKDAVRRHSLAGAGSENPKNRVCVVLKDADALDRCRLGDLDPRYLRLERTPMMIEYARRLYNETCDPEHSDWNTVWNSAVNIFNPSLGFSEMHPPQYDPNEPARERMLRRVKSGKMLKDPQRFLDRMREAMTENTIMMSALARPVGDVAPVIYMNDERYEQFMRDGYYKNIWDTGATWHAKYNDTPLDARAYNEVRLFGEACRHMAHGILFGEEVMIPSAVTRLPQMYGNRRVVLKPVVLESASFTAGDNQMSPFAFPYSPENISLVRVLHWVSHLRALSIRTEWDRINNTFARIVGDEPFRYFELQFHEKITPAQVESAS
jgi:hypothetical protein